ncbi:hypothetical protein SpCBS45565_g03282 [Spizellomyces sp. 'palustris']|nr:hypothetical protein SpCBS45565_g03282 [Spizellomyces sp. 'palustris']
MEFDLEIFGGIVPMHDFDMPMCNEDISSFSCTASDTTESLSDRSASPSLEPSSPASAPVTHDKADKETLLRFDTLTETIKEEEPATGIFVDNMIELGYGKVDTQLWGMTYPEPAGAAYFEPYGLLTPVAEKAVPFFADQIQQYPVVEYDYLPTPTDERSMSFSSASSGCCSEPEMSSPVMQPRQLQTPPPSPSSGKATLKPDEDEEVGLDESVITTEPTATVAAPKSAGKSKGLRGIPSDQFFVMENAFTPSRPQNFRQQQHFSHPSVTPHYHPYQPASNARTVAYRPAPLTISPTATYASTAAPAHSTLSPKPSSPTPTTPLSAPALPTTIAPVRSSSNRSTSSPHPKPFHCEMCPASFSRKHDLKRHTRIHLGIRPFKCDACGKVFSRHDALNRHVIKWGCNKKLEAMAVAAAAAAAAAANGGSPFVVSQEMVNMGYGMSMGVVPHQGMDAYGLGMSY